MPTKKQGKKQSSPTSTETQAKEKTAMLSEQTFKRSFTPLISKKDGSSRLTFAGYRHSVSKDGERPYFSIVFSCMDITRENPANISVLSAYRYNETNVLGKLLTAMGYNLGERQEQILDPDDEFGYVVKEDLSTIYEFLDSQKGLVFKGDMTQGERNLYRIEVSSLKPLMDKDGKQQRDYDAQEGLSENEIAIDLQADGGDDDNSNEE